MGAVNGVAVAKIVPVHSQYQCPYKRSYYTTPNKVRVYNILNLFCVTVVYIFPLEVCVRGRI